MRLAIVTTHPIQYNAPLFALLSQEPTLQVKVFYTWSQSQDGNKYDPGFGKVIEWDIPLLTGYEYSFVKNVSAQPGSHHFKGIINPTLISEINEWDPSAVLVYGWSFSSHLQCIRYFSRKKTVLFRGDSTLLDEKKGARTFVRRLFLKWVYSHIDYALYTGTANKAYFEKHGVKASQLVLAPHAVDNKRFADNGNLYAEKAKQLRESLGFTEKDVVVLFAGKFETKKSPQTIIKLLNENPNRNLKALLVGNGILEKELKETAAGDDRVVFLNFQNQQQMPVIYRVGDIFVLPSVGPGETWGLALNEAMACGRAVAASNKTGGAPDLIDNNANGVVFGTDDISPLSSLLQKALENKDVLIAMGKYSQQKIIQFSFKNVARAITSVTNTSALKA